MHAEPGAVWEHERAARSLRRDGGGGHSSTQGAVLHGSRGTLQPDREICRIARFPSERRVSSSPSSRRLAARLGATPAHALSQASFRPARAPLPLQRRCRCRAPRTSRGASQRRRSARSPLRPPATLSLSLPALFAARSSDLNSSRSSPSRTDLRVARTTKLHSPSPALAARASLYHLALLACGK